MYVFMKNTFEEHDIQTKYWHCKLNVWNGVYRILEKISSYTHIIYIYAYLYTEKETHRLRER